MKDINNVNLTGRLCENAELKYTNSGLAICKLRVANNYTKKEGDEWKEYANFFDCVLWGKIAEALEKKLTKGAQVTIDGELRQNRYEHEGQKRSKIEIIVNNIIIGASGKSVNSDDYEDSEIPF